MIHQVIPVSAGVGEPEGKLYTYLWDASEELELGKTRPLILMCPGGAYKRTSDREAEPMALTFMAMGYHVAVLRYSCGEGIHYPTALLQLAKSMKIIREHAEEWGVRKDKIIVQGCSAGGHLAASLGVFWKKKENLWRMIGADAETVKPDGLLLSYSVITAGEFANHSSMEGLLGENLLNCERLLEEQSLEKHVSEDVPVTFLWHTLTDEAVPVQNSLLFLSALCSAHVPTEFHLYPEGKHGLGLANRLTMGPGGRGIEEGCESWIDLAKTWLSRYFPWDGDAQ